MNSTQPEDGLLQAGWSSAIEFRSSIAFALITALAMILYSFSAPTKRSAEAPFVGYRSSWEPTLLLRLRFCIGALPILREGYKNVRAFSAHSPISSRTPLINIYQFKDSMFMIRRVDTDILIISNKYVEELRALPKLNAIEAHVKVSVFQERSLLRSDNHMIR